MSNSSFDDQSTLVLVMACCLTATSHYLRHCWPRSMSPCGVIRPQWEKYHPSQRRILILGPLRFITSLRKNIYFLIFFMPLPLWFLRTSTWWILCVVYACSDVVFIFSWAIFSLMAWVIFNRSLSLPRDFLPLSESHMNHKTCAAILSRVVWNYQLQFRWGIKLSCEFFLPSKLKQQ